MHNSDVLENTESLDTLFPHQLGRVNEMLSKVTQSGYYKRTFDSSMTTLGSLSDLQLLPILRKSDFVDLQKAQAPFGGLMAEGSRPDYLFISPGPIHEPGFLSPEYWRIESVMRAAGFVAGDIIHNTFSYHLTPGAWMFDSGSRALGCSVIPAGNAAIDMQMHAITHYQATCYAGTPDFLKKLMDSYHLAGLGEFPIKKAVVSGGPLTDGLRKFFTDSGVYVVQCYATAELGCIAIEDAETRLMRVDNDIVVEIVDSGTGMAMPYGEVGEVVVTTLRTDYPLIRFGTGDLSAFASDADINNGPSIVGWLGRSDQAVKVRGVFVRPQQLEMFCKEVEGLNKVRLIIDRNNEQDHAVLFCGFSSDTVISDTEYTEQQLVGALRQSCQLKIDISIVDESTLADDGRLIVDMR